jgi:uncharacterized protein (DUF433 family)
MNYSYEVVPLWQRPSEELLRADLGVVPLAVLGRLPENLSLEDGLTVVAQRLAERIIQEAPPERGRKLLTDAYLLTGLRLRRDAAARFFRGVRAMQESDTYLAILHEGQESRRHDHWEESVMTHARISIDPAIMFGKPVIKGTRVTVELILRKLGASMTDAQIMEHHPHLSVEDIRAAAAFAADHLADEEIVVASGARL